MLIGRPLKRGGSTLYKKSITTTKNIIVLIKLVERVILSHMLVFIHYCFLLLNIPLNIAMDKVFHNH